jgi:small-conductance mechanosensitive channel
MPSWATPAAPYLRELAAVGVILLAAALGWIARRFVLVRLGRVARRTAWSRDDELVDSLRRPLPLWVLLGGVYLALRIVEPAPQLMAWAGKALLAVLIVSVTAWAADAGGRLLGARSDTAEAAVPVAGVVRRTVQGLVVVTGGLVLLGSFGISIAPVLTTLGIGGLAVALGLQDTLANLFAGIHLTLAGNIRVGDFVRLETGEEGYVQDIRWRATCLRTLPNNLVVIPNSRLAQNVVTNYDLPGKEEAVLLQVGVAYASDLAQVERVAIETTRRVLQELPGAVAEFEPFIRYHTFGESSIDFTIIARGRHHTDQFLIKHELVKALARSFASEGIVIPFPIRALDLRQQRPAVASAS